LSIPKKGEIEEMWKDVNSEKTSDP
jgi:hypothetical protein